MLERAPKGVRPTLQCRLPHAASRGRVCACLRSAPRPTDSVGFFTRGSSASFCTIMRQAADDWQPRRAASGSGAAGANASAAGTAAAQHSATTALRMLQTRSEEAEHELGCWQNEKSTDDEQTFLVEKAPQI